MPRSDLERWSSDRQQSTACMFVSATHARRSCFRFLRAGVFIPLAVHVDLYTPMRSNCLSIYVSRAAAIPCDVIQPGSGHEFIAEARHHGALFGSRLVARLDDHVPLP